MAAYVLRLLHDRLAADAATLNLRACDRLFYAVNGELMVDDGAVAPDEALYRPATCRVTAGPAGAEYLRWELLKAPVSDDGTVEAEGVESALELSVDIKLDAAQDYMLRCDRVDFPPGGVAFKHTHPGPGIRCQMQGRITIDTKGKQTEYGPGEAWFEVGPAPVLATTWDKGDSYFVRAMVLPREWRGKRTIKYLDARDADKPKTQRATVLSEELIDL